jgi:hypothetical protein
VRATLVALCLLAGCRQVLGIESSVLFDAGADTSGDVDVDAAGCGTNDFDLDGLPDNCDLCPHVPSNGQADLDGDGVGDECDPRPAEEDARALWLGFYSPNEIAGWTPINGGSWQVSNHVLHETSMTFTMLDSPISYTTDIHFATSLVMTAPGTMEVGFCAANVQPSSQYYCCAAANATGGKANIIARAQYMGHPQTALIGDLGAGFTANERIDIQGTLAGSQFKCEFARDNGDHKEAMLAAGAKAGPVSFYATAPVDYRYVFVVTMAP